MLQLTIIRLSNKSFAYVITLHWNARYTRDRRNTGMLTLALGKLAALLQKWVHISGGAIWFQVYDLQKKDDSDCNSMLHILKD